MPRIRFKKWNLSQETKLFIRFLNHPDFPTRRRFILQTFPELRKTLTIQKNEGKAVNLFLRKFYKKNKDKVIAVSRKSRAQLAKNAPQALRALGKAMEYSWQKKTIYVATPTLLPFSPFGTNQFYFSILGVITKQDDVNVVRTAIHEISHFVFFDVLRQIEQRERFALPPDALHLLKESLTAALLNEEPLRRTLRIDNYPGNPEIHELYIKLPRCKPILFTDYIRRAYTTSQKQRRLFGEILHAIVLSAYRSRVMFAKKRAFWNRYGRQILSEPLLRKRYQIPILFGK